MNNSMDYSLADIERRFAKIRVGSSSMFEEDMNRSSTPLSHLQSQRSESRSSQRRSASVPLYENSMRIYASDLREQIINLSKRNSASDDHLHMDSIGSFVSSTADDSLRNNLTTLSESESSFASKVEFFNSLTRQKESFHGMIMGRNRRPSTAIKPVAVGCSGNECTVSMQSPQDQSLQCRQSKSPKSPKPRKMSIKLSITVTSTSTPNRSTGDPTAQNLSVISSVNELNASATPKISTARSDFTKKSVRSRIAEFEQRISRTR